MSLAARALDRTFAPLRNRNLSLYLGGQAISLFGTMMQMTALSWVVWEVSHSTRALGLVSMVSNLPMMVLGGLAGVWADRLDRRKVLVGTQIAAMLLAFLFAALVQAHSIQLWHVYLISIALGCVSALDMPAQSAFVGDLIGLDQVRGAVVLNSMIMQVSRTVGPALAGLVMGSLGVAMAFWINGASFLAVIGSLLAVRSHQVRKPADQAGKGEMREAFRFIGRDPRFVDLLICCVLTTFFAWGIGFLIPAVVTDYLHAGPELVGWINAASGAGALFSSLVIVPLLQHIRRAGWVVTSAVVFTGFWFGVIAYASSPLAWVAGAFCGSLGTPVVMTTAGALMQLLAPPEMKARLMSVWMIAAFGAIPFGSLLIGYLAHMVGVQTAVLIYGAALVAGGASLIALRPGLRRWEPAPQHDGGHGAAVGEA